LNRSDPRLDLDRNPFLFRQSSSCWWEDTVASTTNKALKEWAAVVEALGQGKQTILLRKYAPAKREFLLYPTYEFARRKSYLDIFQAEYRAVAKQAVAAKRAKLTEIKCYVSVTQVIRVEKAGLPSLRTLSRLYIWTPEHVQQYFAKADEAFVWLLKVELLSKPGIIKDLPRGAITYANLPEPIPTDGRSPVLSDNLLRTVESQVKDGIQKLESRSFRRRKSKRLRRCPIPD